jgi:hypothetical protein
MIDVDGKLYQHKKYDSTLIPTNFICKDMLMVTYYSIEIQDIEDNIYHMQDGVFSKMDLPKIKSVYHSKYGSVLQDYDDGIWIRFLGDIVKICTFNNVRYITLYNSLVHILDNNDRVWVYEHGTGKPPRLESYLADAFPNQPVQSICTKSARKI